ncbi:MAG TPA: hypothetical protein VGC77_08680 [Rhodopseudomonas sp.]|uniref:hypothetical protein n=1 Tax=Rhodopseudomonas sp. TaxID=1078 RepID=UPI002ED7D37B
MTVEQYTPPEFYTVAGTGPYAVPFPYRNGAVVAHVETEDGVSTLDLSDYGTVPEEAASAGNLFLIADAAAAYAGRRLWIERATPLEQGWLGLHTREKGMESQLDQITMAVQETQDGVSRSLRSYTAIPPIAPIEGRALIGGPDGTILTDGPNAADIADAGANAATAVAARDDAALSAAQAALYGPLTFPSASAFLASDQLVALWIGKRAGTQDGSAAWDIVAAATGDFDHPITGVGVKIVGTARSWATPVLADYAPMVNSQLALGMELNVPVGSHPVGATIIVPYEGKLRGVSESRSKLLKKASFTGNGLLLEGYSEVVGFTVDGEAGNGGNGIQLIGGRNDLRNMQVMNQGGHGLVVGRGVGETGNINLWNVTNVISILNAGHGMYVSDNANPAAPDVNAGRLYGLDARANGGDGLHMGAAYDCQLMGVSAQHNTGAGIRFAGYGTNWTAGHFMPVPYTEDNGDGDVVLGAYSRRNYIFGVRAGIVNLPVTNLGQDNFVIDRAGSTTTVPRHAAPEAFEDLRMMKAGSGGIWKWLLDSAGNLNLTNDSGGARDLIMSGGRGLRVQPDASAHALDSALRAMRTGITTLNLGSVAAGGAASIGYTSANFSDLDRTKWLLTATPDFDAPAGLTWSVSFLAASSNIRLTVHNGGASAWDGSASAWVFRALKISAAA